MTLLIQYLFSLFCYVDQSSITVRKLPCATSRFLACFDTTRSSARLRALTHVAAIEITTVMTNVQSALLLISAASNENVPFTPCSFNNKLVPPVPCIASTEGDYRAEDARLEPTWPPTALRVSSLPGSFCDVPIASQTQARATAQGIRGLIDGEAFYVLEQIKAGKFTSCYTCNEFWGYVLEIRAGKLPKSWKKSLGSCSDKQGDRRL